MKKIFLLILPAIIFSCQPGNHPLPGKDELTALLMSYYDALAKKDIEKMKSLTTNNFVLYDEGVIYSNESALDFVKDLPAFTATFKLDSLNTHIDKTNASAYYLREAVFTMEDSTYAPVKFLESATFNKVKNEWKIRFLHSTLRKQ